MAELTGAADDQHTPPGNGAAALLEASEALAVRLARIEALAAQTSGLDSRHPRQIAS